MSQNENTVVGTVIQTAASLAPQIASANPTAAAVLALAPVAIQFLQSATTLQQAGVMTPEELASLFASVGRGVQSTHDRWAALNAAEKAAQ